MDSKVKIASASDLFNIQRTRRGKAYDDFMSSYFEAMRDPSERKRADESFLQVKGVAKGDVHADTFLTNMSQMYQNDAYIGEQLVMVVPVEKRTNKYAIYPQREMFESPTDVLSSDRARANEISETRTSSSYELIDYGYENFLSNETLSNQDPPFNERVDAVTHLAEHLARKREIRIASFLTTTTNYGSGNSTTLSGSSQWDSTAGGDPVKDIQVAKAALFNGPGATELVAFSSREVFNALARHPALLDLQKYTTLGLLTPAAIAQYFGFSAYLVGDARKQTANEGQTASYSRIWGLDFGIVRVARAPSLRTASFASLFRKSEDPVVTEWFDATAGKSGGYYTKMAVSEDLRAVSSFAGYIIKSATAA